MSQRIRKTPLRHDSSKFSVISVVLGDSVGYTSPTIIRIWVDNSFSGLGLVLTGQADTLLIGIALGGTFLLNQQTRRGARIDEKTTTTHDKSSSPFSTGELLPNNATHVREIETANETPEQVLGELEKQDF